MHTCVHTNTHSYKHYIHTDVHYKHTYTHYTYNHTHIHIYIHTCTICMLACMQHAYIHTYMCTYTQHKCMRTCTHHIHNIMPPHTQTLQCNCPSHCMTQTYTTQKGANAAEAINRNHASCVIVPMSASANLVPHTQSTISCQRHYLQFRKHNICNDVLTTKTNQLYIDTLRSRLSAHKNGCLYQAICFRNLRMMTQK